MATYFDRITDEQADLIRRSPLFFVASAAPDGTPGPAGEGPVNVSPKGGVTVMVCSFEPDDAAIVRLYGRARAVPLAGSTLAATFEAEERLRMSASRQVIEVDVARTMTSCGYGVPVMRFERERRREDRGRRFKPKD